MCSPTTCSGPDRCCDTSINKCKGDVDSLSPLLVLTTSVVQSPRSCGAWGNTCTDCRDDLNNLKACAPNGTCVVGVPLTQCDIYTSPHSFHTCAHAFFLFISPQSPDGCKPATCPDGCCGFDGLCHTETIPGHPQLPPDPLNRRDPFLPPPLFSAHPILSLTVLWPADGIYTGGIMCPDECNEHHNKTTVQGTIKCDAGGRCEPNSLSLSFLPLSLSSPITLSYRRFSL